MEGSGRVCFIYNYSVCSDTVDESRWTTRNRNSRNRTENLDRASYGMPRLYCTCTVRRRLHGWRLVRIVSSATASNVQVGMGLSNKELPNEPSNDKKKKGSHSQIQTGLNKEQNRTNWSSLENSDRKVRSKINE